MKYRTHIQVVLKSGHHLESRSNNFEHADHEEVIAEILTMREFMDKMVRKKLDGEAMNDGILNVGTWQIDAMEVAAFSMDLYKVEDDGRGCYNETLVEVPMP